MTSVFLIVHIIVFNPCDHVIDASVTHVLKIASTWYVTCLASSLSTPTLYQHFSIHVFIFLSHTHVLKLSTTWPASFFCYLMLSQYFIFISTIVLYSSLNYKRQAVVRRISFFHSLRCHHMYRLMSPRDPQYLVLTLFEDWLSIHLLRRWKSDNG